MEHPTLVNAYQQTPSHVWAETKITPHLSDFMADYPEIKLDIECNDTVQDMIEDRLDLVIRVGDLEDSSSIAIPFGSIQLVMLATKTYLEQHGQPKTPSDLHNHNFIIYKTFNQLSITERGETHQINVSSSISSNTVSVMLSALEQSMGMAILPDLLANHFLQDGKLVNVMPEVKIKLKNLPISQVFALYSNRKHLPAKVRAFIDFFRPRFN
jgi:DNA-binding transcriptional LysR family regulator